VPNFTGKGGRISFKTRASEKGKTKERGGEWGKTGKIGLSLKRVKGVSIHKDHLPQGE